MKNKALIAAATVAFGIGLAVPTQASAAQTSPRSVVGGEAGAAGIVISCDDTSSPLENEPASESTKACLIFSNDSVSAGANLTFNAPDPAKWTACSYAVGLYALNPSGVETLLASAPAQDCLSQARAGQLISGGIPPVALTDTVTTYYSKVFLFSEYDGKQAFGWVAVSQKLEAAA